MLFKTRKDGYIIVQIFLFIAAFIAVLAVIFALQNAVPITVSFLFWQVNSSLALVLIMAFIAGLITSFLFNLLAHLKRTKATIPLNPKSLEKQFEETEKDNDINEQDE